MFFIWEIYAGSFNLSIYNGDKPEIQAWTPDLPFSSSETLDDLLTPASQFPHI
jgi:hypothetical protein